MRLRSLILLSAITLAGCLPGGTWLPDSSGFVFTAGHNYEQLVFFDSRTGKTSVLVKDIGAPTFWPAGSPDGKQIAVARKRVKGETATLQLVFYDRSGKELEATEQFRWHPPVTKPAEIREFLNGTQPVLFWSPLGDRI